MPSAVYSSESGLESESLHNASCASSAHPHPRGLFSLSAQQQRYSALQASMSSGDNFIQARNLSLGGGHGHGFMGGRVWSPFAGIAPGPGAGQGAHEVSPQAVMAEKELVAEEHDSNNEHGAGGFAEHDYMSDVSSAPADEKERSEVKGDDALDTDSNLNMRETELRLGPLGPPPSGEDGRLMQAGAKRGFSEAIGGLSESKRSLSDPTEAKRSFPEATNGSGNGNGNGSGAGEVGELRARNGSAGSTALGMKSPCFSDHGGLKECSDGRPSFPSLFSGFSAAKLGGAGDADGKLGNGKHPSGFRVPSLPPPWQALEQSAGSFGPFPSQKSPLEVPSPAKFIGEGGSMCGRDMSFSWENNRVPRSGGGDSTPTSGQCSAFASEGSTVESGRNAATPSSDAAASPAGRSAPVVGWPPVRAVRKSSVPSPPPLKGGESHCVSPSTGKATLATPAVPRPVLEGLPKAMRPSGEAGPRASSNPSPTAVSSNYCFVKVYMDGIPFGRKVDLRIHSCYEKLSVVLEEMFTRYVEQSATGDGKPLKLLQGSEYVLTYEDQDGDLMLVGDVPWTLFIGSVKRLRIMKRSEAACIPPRNSPKLWKGGAT